MFNDKYGLTQAVLEGRKTMTRRMIPGAVFEKYHDYLDSFGCEAGFRHLETIFEFANNHSQYKIG